MGEGEGGAVKGGGQAGCDRSREGCHREGAGGRGGQDQEPKGRGADEKEVRTGMFGFLLTLLLSGRAAITLQRAWRQYKVLQQQSKKKKKGKKK